MGPNGTLAGREVMRSIDFASQKVNTPHPCKSFNPIIPIVLHERIGNELHKFRPVLHPRFIRRELEIRGECRPVEDLLG